MILFDSSVVIDARDSNSPFRVKTYFPQRGTDCASK